MFLLAARSGGTDTLWGWLVPGFVSLHVVPGLLTLLCGLRVWVAWWGSRVGLLVVDRVWLTGVGWFG